jgi:hypothetical protein
VFDDTASDALALLSRLIAGVQFTQAGPSPLQNYPLLILALAIPVFAIEQAWLAPL